VEVTSSDKRSSLLRTGIKFYSIGPAVFCNDTNTKLNLAISKKYILFEVFCVLRFLCV
jgi:hypothetical protein